MMKTMRWPRTVKILVQGIGFLLFLAAFFGGGWLTASLMKFHEGPLFLRFLCDFSLSAAILLFLSLLLTWIFGRFYCGILCPLGAIQDALGAAVARRKRRIPDLFKLRLFLTGMILAVAAGASQSMGFLLLDPYSNAGRMVSDFSWGCAAAWLILIVLVLAKKRIFCTSLCPVGTILGLAAAKGVFQLKINSKCIHCGQCAIRCPAGAIDPAAGKVDNERCLRCLACLSLCRVGAIHFGLRGKGTPAPDSSRRKFLIRSAVFLGGIAAGIALGKSGIGRLISLGSRSGVFPPGAGSGAVFASRCTACQLCVKKCPAKIIVPGRNGVGPVSLDFSRGACRYDCNICSQVCPTGALKPLSLGEKQRTQIAEARFNPRNCLVFQEGEACGKCAGVCPTGAITLRRSGAPYPVNAALCIGCGACQFVCPAEPKAVTIQEMEQQLRKG